MYFAFASGQLQPRGFGRQQLLALRLGRRRVAAGAGVRQHVLRQVLRPRVQRFPASSLKGPVVPNPPRRDRSLRRDAGLTRVVVPDGVPAQVLEEPDTPRLTDEAGLPWQIGVGGRRHGAQQVAPCPTQEDSVRQSPARGRSLGGTGSDGRGLDLA